MRFYRNADTLTAEQDQFEIDLDEFSKGHIDPVKFKAIRVAHGVYEQRQDHTYMIRIRCAAGGITPEQLKKTSELAELYGGGEVHFTTRQEVQVHEVTIQNIMNVIRGLHEVGLSSRGGGGNTIRNILTSADSGISKNEVFDVDPYAIELTTRLINEPDSWNLPRKFKIAMSNGPDDTSYTQATCLGYVAKMKDGQKGFEVHCAGGMGVKPMVGHLLLDWIPDTQTYHVARAIKTMFDKHGNRRNRNQNRIKFLWKKLDREEFVRLFMEEYDKIKDDASLNLELPVVDNSAKAADLAVDAVTTDAFETWKKRFATEQKQDGLYSVLVPLQLGDLYRKDANLICDFLAHFGDNTIRCDRAQNMRLRNIPEQYLGNLYNIIQQMDTLSDHAAFIGKMINCTGAQTCKLGICLPRGLSKAIRTRLIDSELDLDQIADFRLNMSGCPNTCGMHHIAHLGFFGKVGRNKGDLFPSYNVLAGARVGFGKTEYAQKVNDIAAHFVPDFVHDFLGDYIAKKATYNNDYNAYLEAEGTDLINELCGKYKTVPSFEDDPKFYTDFGANRRLSLEELGTAECSAGMFDMIDVDKKMINRTRKTLGDITDAEELANALFQILFHTSRMLLVTRGLDAKTEADTLKLFEKHFVQTELVSPKFSPLVKLGFNGPTTGLNNKQEELLAMADEVLALYKGMDDSLRFSAEKVAPVKEANQKDFRGVACPMNFVKTKLVLETMNSGEQLEILLDDGQPIQNVPGSVQQEGHTIVKKEKSGDHWVVLIQKN